MSYLKKNDRFQPGCAGSLYFNPTTVSKQALTYVTYSTSNGAVQMYVNSGQFINGNIISFGGQVVGYVYDETNGNGANIYFPEETWPNMEANGAQILTEYLNNYDYIYSFLPNYDYFYEFNSVQHGTGYTKHPDTCIENVRIKDYSDVTKRKTFGFHRKQFDILKEHHATIEIPAETDKLKIDQMLNSDAVIFVPDNRTVSVLLMPNGWKFDKPKGGGSINPIGRKVSINTNSIKYGLRRGYQLFDVILEG